MLSITLVTMLVAVAMNVWLTVRIQRVEAELVAIRRYLVRKQ